MHPRTWTDDQLRDAVKTSTSIRQVLGKLGMQKSGGNYPIVKGWIKQLGIDASNLTGKGDSPSGGSKIDLKDILVADSSYQSFKLKNRLIKEGIFQEVCASCGKTHWKSRTTKNIVVKIPLELEHKNGNNRDNRLANLELLCPICHAFTDTYGGKNKKR
jgi:hypothetical protein